MAQQQNSSTVEELRSEINELRKELDKEKSKYKRSTIPFGNHENMKRVKTPRELIEVDIAEGSDVTRMQTKISKREVELESDNGRLKNQIQELKHFTQNLEIERKALLDRHVNLIQITNDHFS